MHCKAPSVDLFSSFEMGAKAFMSGVDPHGLNFLGLWNS